MAKSAASYISHFHLLGLELSQGADERVRRLKMSIAELPELLDEPAAPMLPLLGSLAAPRPPVTGLLPRCPAAPVFGDSLTIVGGGPQGGGPSWLVWPVELGGWYAELRASLAGTVPDEASGDDWRAALNGGYPLGPFIPLAAADGEADSLPVVAASRQRETETLLEHPPPWRSMVLSCRRIDTDPRRKWFLSAFWRTVWTRRLRRAP